MQPRGDRYGIVHRYPAFDQRGLQSLSTPHAGANHLAQAAPPGAIRQELSLTTQGQLVEVEIRDPLGVTTTPICPDATPHDGRWSCNWMVSGSYGDEFNIRVRITDGLGHVSAWTNPGCNVVLNAVPPTVTLDSGAQAAAQGQIIGQGGYQLTGIFTDSSGAAQVCCQADADPLCEVTATLLATVVPTSTASVYDDIPGAPIAITATRSACGGGEFACTFDVTDTFIAGDVDLGFNATHDWHDDILVELVSPSGTHMRAILGDLADAFRNYDVWLDDALGPLHNSADDDADLPY